MKLKPCPFCGNDDIEVDETDSGILGLSGEYFVWCFECGAQTGAYFERKADARKAWNRRAKPEEKP